MSKVKSSKWQKTVVTALEANSAKHCFSNIVLNKNKIQHLRQNKIMLAIPLYKAFENMP